MKVGDLLDFEVDTNQILPAIVLEVWDFKKYCDTADEAELEYDIDEAWKHWRVSGPLTVVLHPIDHVPVKFWPNLKVDSESR